MSDDTVLPGTGEVIRDLDKGGRKTQVMALDVGGAGTEKLLSEDNPLPISKQDEIIYLLSAILEKLPRTDTADRVMVSHAESNPTVSIATNQDLRNITGTVGSLVSIGGRDAAHAAYALANMGALHIYDKIIVS